MRRQLIVRATFLVCCWSVCVLAASGPAAGADQLLRPEGPILAGESFVLDLVGEWIYFQPGLDEVPEVSVERGIITVAVRAQVPPILSPIEVYALHAEIPPLAAGRYTVRLLVLEPAGAGDVVHVEYPLEVQARRAQIEPVDSPLVAGDAATLRLTGRSTCSPSADALPVAEVVGRFVLVEMAIDCPTSAPVDYELFVETPPLAPGRYELVLLPPPDGAEADPQKGYARGFLEVLTEPVVADRFAVRAEWTDFQGEGGIGRPALPATDESALLWFFGAENWELMVKVLDGCGINGHHWIYAAASTNVGFELTVEDLLTGEMWSFDNPLGARSPAATDIVALPCVEGDLASLAPGSPPEDEESQLSSWADGPLDAAGFSFASPYLGSVVTSQAVPVDTLPVTMWAFGDWPCCNEPVVSAAVDPDAQIVTVFFDGSTTGGAVAVPYAEKLEIDPLSPGRWLFRAVARDRDADLETVASDERFFTVRPGMEIETPDALATDAEPVELTVRGVGTCPVIEIDEIDGDTIRLVYLEAPCPPTDDTPFEFGLLLALAAGRYDVELRNGLLAGAILARTGLEVVEEPTTVQDGRFQIEVSWADFVGAQGTGRPAVPPSDDSALFWFFGPENWELMVKVLDACALNGHYWVFGAATTDVEYTLRVTDTETGAEWSLTNPLGTASEAITDIEAFACDL